MNLTIGNHVLQALREKAPLVALETALVTHGLPRPLNLETALAMEAAVRETGAVPCTIGMIEGRLIIGLSADELSVLANTDDPLKLGVRELPAAMALRKSGGTTVAATAYLAHRYGIRVFVTGGIGGVHRGARETFDISGDLTVLGRTPITVISSGAKAILDLKLTLEYLETAGITVIGFKTGFFPAFYSVRSPYSLSIRLESATEVARSVLLRDGLGLPGALLVCNPVPADTEIAWDELMAFIKRVDEEINEQGVGGQDVTPKMLQRLFEMTGGRTLQANLALLRENARLGGEISKAVCEERGLS